MKLYNNIPDLLKNQQQWVVWGVPGELPKFPHNPNELLRLNISPAKSGAPETWGSFEDAVQCVTKGLARGIGYEFNNNNIYGIDLDRVIDYNGTISDEARKIIDDIGSYTEISPSRTGIHIFVTADNADITRHRKQGGFIEIYNDKRFFTVTGDIFEGYNRIEHRPVELQKLHDTYLKPTVESREATRQSNPDSINYLERGLDKDPVMRACWNGEHRRGDESASDQALMNKLAYWTNADSNAMITAFMQSPYYAQKDEYHKKKCDRSDYLPNTANVACAYLRSTAEEDIHRYHKTRLRGEAR